MVTGVNLLRDRLLFSVLYYTGCSESELITLTFSQIDFRTHTISFGKRTASIPEKLASELKEHGLSQTSSYVFSSRQSHHMSAKRVQQLIAQYARQILGKGMTPQDIRYLHIYHALLKGTSIISIAQQTGLSYQRLAQIIEAIAAVEELGYRYEL